MYIYAGGRSYNSHLHSHHHEMTINSAQYVCSAVNMSIRNAQSTQYTTCFTMRCINISTRPTHIIRFILFVLLLLNDLLVSTRFSSRTCSCPSEKCIHVFVQVNGESILLWAMYVFCSCICVRYSVVRSTNNNISSSSSSQPTGHNSTVTHTRSVRLSNFIRYYTLFYKISHA